MTIQQLQEEYQKDITIEEATISKRVLIIPKIMSKYQNFYFYTLEKISKLYDMKEKTYNDVLIDYKMGQSELSKIVLSSTELKRALEATVLYREIKLELYHKENELKLCEEMIKTIREISWGIKNLIDYQKLQMGIV